MNLTSPDSVVILESPDWTNLSDKFKYNQWYQLGIILRDQKFRFGMEEELISAYHDFGDWKLFLDVQLKFFLLRNSANRENRLIDLMQFWFKNLPGAFKVNSAGLVFPIQFHQASFQRAVGLFRYPVWDLILYAKAWRDETIDLPTWRRLRFILVPSDIEGFLRCFENCDDFTLKPETIKKLYNDEVEQIFEVKFKPRLKNKELSRNEKQLIHRVLHLTGTNNDLDYLNRNFLNTPYANQIVEKLHRCKQDNLNKAEYDIHSLDSMKMYSALLKYFESLSKEGKKVNVVPSMHFHRIPTHREKMNEVYERLHDVFDVIQPNCPNAKWADFKSIFKKNGSNLKINWTGDVEKLNYIFRKLGRNVQYDGGSKWEVIANFFYDEGKNNEALTAERLEGNSHLDEKKNETLVTPVKSLISTLRCK